MTGLGRPLRSALVADDDPDVRERWSPSQFLEQAEGFQVRAVADGVHAPEAIADERPSIALIDVMMPGLSGIDVVRELRRDPATRSLPIVLLTAKAQERRRRGQRLPRPRRRLRWPSHVQPGVSLLSRVTAPMARGWKGEPRLRPTPRSSRWRWASC